MLRIRLSRAGTKNKPFYKIVLTDRKIRSKGAPKEVLGWWKLKENPSIDTQRLALWERRGAVKSRAVENLLSQIK